MEELKKYLISEGILQEYIQCITDERTNQGTDRENRHIGDALISFHVWSYSEDVFPGVSEDDWINYHNHWESIAPDVIIPSHKWLVEQLANKKVKLLNSIKDFR